MPSGSPNFRDTIPILPVVVFVAILGLADYGFSQFSPSASSTALTAAAEAPSHSENPDANKGQDVTLNGEGKEVSDKPSDGPGKIQYVDLRGDEQTLTDTSNTSNTSLTEIANQWMDTQPPQQPSVFDTGAAPLNNFDVPFSSELNDTSNGSWEDAQYAVGNELTPAGLAFGPPYTPSFNGYFRGEQNNLSWQNSSVPQWMFPYVDAMGAGFSNSQFSGAPVFDESTGQYAGESPDIPNGGAAAPLLEGQESRPPEGTVFDDQGNVVLVPPNPVVTQYPMQEFDTPPSENNIENGTPGNPLPGPIPSEYEPLPGEKFVVGPNGQPYQNTQLLSPTSLLNQQNGLYGGAVPSQPNSTFGPPQTSTAPSPSTFFGSILNLFGSFLK